jgi:hypothetical protein
MRSASAGEVVLDEGLSASAHLHRVLTATVDDHPEVFDDVRLWTSARDLRDRYAELLPEFEAVRADSQHRCELAAEIAANARSVFAWRTGSGEIPLAEHLAEPADPLPLESRALRGNGGMRPRVPRGGVELEGDELIGYADALVARGSASPAVADAVAWVVAQAAGDRVDLSGRRVVVLGAAAELAPSRLWLEGGADVLWIDTVGPPPDLLESDDLAGSVHWVAEGADLLADTRRIRATVEEFAQGEPVDMGLYAYAPGQVREWRLAGAMNAIVDALAVGSVGNVTMLVSATTCGVLTPEEVEGETRRREDRPRWQAVLDAAGLLGKGGGHVRHGDTCANRGIVEIQGTSYQAAQYLGKLMAAEAWATATGDRSMHVSANTAGISRTASVRHPVFDTAFGGAAAFAVETFEPATTAALNALLTLRDRLVAAEQTPAADDETSIQDRARALSAARVHGGVYQLPYPIGPTLKVATALGVAKDPRRIASLVRRKRAT